MATGRDNPSESIPLPCLDRPDAKVPRFEDEEKSRADTTAPVIPDEGTRETVEKTEAADDDNSDVEGDGHWSTPNLPLMLNFVSRAVLGALKGGRDFSIAHDVRAAEWFGDFVFRYPSSDGEGILHSLTSIIGLPEGAKACDGCGEGQNKVTTTDLSSAQGPYALEKYLNSYAKMLKSDDLQGGIERLTVVTVGGGEALASSDCLEQVEENEEALSGLQVKVLKDKEMWRRSLLQKHEPEWKDLITEFLEKLHFAEYTPTDSSELVPVLEEICPTQRPETFYLMLKENLEEWLTSEDGKYLTATDIRGLLAQNSRSLNADAQLQALSNASSGKD